ncbi:YjjG family noncanonical pyrimidine nucleotidase [Marinoscillum sp.]|uniref:YjjG family noncanonical pyrimidine nucleotidase n=1 Tax=Marinoscillum sp. TaxID=2024838 RepID=UPI003BAD1742
MKQFSYLFFDLDHTLWDYDTNARKVLTALYHEFELNSQIKHGPDRFLEIYFKTNDGLWHDYNQGRITKEVIRNDRFKMVLSNCGGADHSRALEMSDYFLTNCPRQPGVMPGTKMTLDYLKKKYPMSIITNGFDDVQEVKLKACGLHGYFDHVFTSETIGVKKPNPEIFEYALQVLGIPKESVLMIGDNPKTDIQGATNAGITPVLYNPTGRIKSECELEIKSLSELMTLL